ncbi:hypothetical protein GCM10010442_39580 [Kitasatospora kifunensis]
MRRPESPQGSAFTPIIVAVLVVMDAVLIILTLQVSMARGLCAALGGSRCDNRSLVQITLVVLGVALVTGLLCLWFRRWFSATLQLLLAAVYGLYGLPVAHETAGSQTGASRAVPAVVQWHTPAFPGLGVDSLTQRLTQRWGLSFQRQSSGIDSPGSQLQSARYTAMNEQPGTYYLGVQVRTDSQGGVRSIECYARGFGARSAQAADTLAECGDLALNHQTTASQQDWVHQHLASQNDPAVQYTGGLGLTDNSVHTVINVGSDETDLTLTRSPTS